MVKSTVIWGVLGIECIIQSGPIVKGVSGKAEVIMSLIPFSPKIERGNYKATHLEKKWISNLKRSAMPCWECILNVLVLRVLFSTMTDDSAKATLDFPWMSYGYDSRISIGYLWDVHCWSNCPSTLSFHIHWISIWLYRKNLLSYKLTSFWRHFNGNRQSRSCGHLKWARRTVQKSSEIFKLYIYGKSKEWTIKLVIVEVNSLRYEMVNIIWEEEKFLQ